MASKESQEKPEAGFLCVLRAAALIALLVGAVGSVGLMLHAGRRKDSPRLLLALFAIWVLAPFVALALANIVSKGWSVITRATLYRVMMVLTLGHWPYTEMLHWDRSPRAKTAFVFVVVPPASWLLIATVVSIAALISRRLSHRS